MFSQRDLDSAYASGYRDGLAAANSPHPAMEQDMIEVTLTNFSVPTTEKELPNISFKAKETTPVHDILHELHKRLPDIPCPLSISTVRAPFGHAGGPRLLSAEEMMTVYQLLPTRSAKTLPLRLDALRAEVCSTEDSRERKASLGSKLRAKLNMASPGPESDTVSAGPSAANHTSSGTTTHLTDGANGTTSGAAYDQSAGNEDPSLPSYEEAVRKGSNNYQATDAKTRDESGE
jgi:hypothetical protein